MSRPKGKDLRGLSAQELTSKVQSLEKELQDLRQKKVTGQLEKPHEFKAARRHIAQLNTILREKENADSRKK